MKELVGLVCFFVALMHANGQDDSHGAEFFIGIPKNAYDEIPNPNSLDLHVTTTSTDAITFHVEDINSVFYTGTVTLDSPTTVNLDFGYMVLDSTYNNRNKGIRVYTDNGGLISVLVVNYITFVVGESVAYPYQELNVPQYVYYTMSTETIDNIMHSLTLLVGTADDTTVIITPSNDIVMPEDIQNSNSLNFVLVAGSSYIITLHRLQTFVFEADNIDLTGSKIVSDKPLTVVSGHECSNVPRNSYFCEATSVQVPPTATWGTKFLLTPHGGRTGGQYYKMVAAEADTTITDNCNNGVPVSNVLTGEGSALTFFTPSGTYCFAESDKPVFTVILGTGGSLSGGLGDPVMSLVPSTDTYAHSDILFYIPNYSGFYSHWINIMSTAPNPEILMNGQVLSLSWTTINDNNGVPAGYAAQMSLSQVGVDHYISSSNPTAPVTTLVHGWGSHRGFSYTAGVEQVNQIAHSTIKINPWYGNILGGTAVTVSGTYFTQTDKVQCAFDGINSTAVYLSTTSVICVCPRLSKVGSTLFELYKNNLVFTSTATFYSLAPEHDNKVTIDNSDVYFRSGDSLDLTWSPTKFVSSDDTGITADDLMIDIKLHELQYNEETSETIDTELAVLASGVENTGSMTVTVPSGASLSNPPSDKVIATVTIFMEARLKPGVTGVLQNVTDRIGHWTDRVSATINDQVNDVLWQKCQEWAEEQPVSIGQTLLDRVSNTPCPPNENQARAVNSGLVRDTNKKLVAFFHPGADRCYRQRTITSANQGSGNQCCYKNGALLVGPSSGGSVDKVAPSGKGFKFAYTTFLHFLEDVIPYIYCCKGDQDVKKARCDLYYEHRPSDDGSNFQPPIPACIYGDPHVVTLDLHKYTFNGKGEFILVQTPNDYLTIQGRMEETKDINGNNAGATVFTAIAAKQSDSQTVQFQLENNGTDIYLVVLVDGTKLNFEIIQSQDFDNVTVSKLENNTLEASFSSGALIRVQEQNDIISLLLVSLPETFKNQTSGLMGSYNGDMTDDLMPPNSNVPISIDSSLQTIHEDFGIFWIVKNAEESLFSYPFAKDWSSYYFPAFVPIYEPTFSDSNLETLANSICQGDPFCLYDIATTQNTAIGQTTQQGGQDLEALIELSQPVSCDPSCVHGVCVDTNVCVCGEGYEGPICNTTVYSECDVNPCNNSGVCQYHAGTYTCTCLPEYSGPYCDIVLPKPTSSTPVMSSSSITTRTTVSSSSTVRTSTSATTERPTAATERQAGVSTGGIIGITAGIGVAIMLVVLVVVGLACFFVFHNRRKMKVGGAHYYGESTDDHKVSLYNMDQVDYNIE